MKYIRIPAGVPINSATLRVLDGQTILVDGDRGCVYLGMGFEA